MVILSHTDPEYPLVDHLRHTRNIARKLMPETKEAERYGLWEIVRTATETHDLGKATTWFQKHLKGERVKEHCMKNHSLISACFAHYVTESRGLDVWQRAATYFAVLGHHGHLKHKKPSRDTDAEIIQKQAENMLSQSGEFLDLVRTTLPDTYKYVERFLKLASEHPEKIVKNTRKTLNRLERAAAKEGMYENVRRFLVTKMAYSLLVSADTISATLRTDKIDHFVKVLPPEPGVLDRYVCRLPKRRWIDRVRSDIYKQARSTKSVNKIHVLELPTGAGKTFAGLRIATSAKKPVIYTLPYTSIIDQTVNILQDKALYDGDVMPYHHLARGFQETDSNEENYDTYQRKLLDQLVENWFAPIVVTTYEQVFYALVWNRKKFAQRMQGIGRSVVLLDEIQAVPQDIWDATWYVLRAANELFGVPLIVMSATLPKVPGHAQEAVERIPVEVPDSEKKVFVRRTFKYCPEINDVKGVSELIARLSKKNKKILCVVNTRCDAYRIYEQVKGVLDRPVFLLSTYVPPKDRLERIRRIKESDEWALISTQVIEAGVDIDADVLIRDIAPLDSIVQSAGRCNRNGKIDMGKVIITELRDEDGKLRAMRVYRDSLLINTTKEILQNMPDGADDKYVENALKEYYESVYERKGKESEKGHESLPVLMGKMWFEEVTKRFQIVEEIPVYKIILADKTVKDTLNRIRNLKKQMRCEENYERRIELSKKIRTKIAFLEQYTVTVFRPSNETGKAKQMLDYLLEKTRDALHRIEEYDGVFVMDLEKLPVDLREKTKEVGISWICGAEDCLEDRFV